MEDEAIISVAEYECVSLKRLVPDAIISLASVNGKFNKANATVRETVFIG